jgi:hypothetical protein
VRKNTPDLSLPYNAMERSASKNVVCAIENCVILCPLRDGIPDENLSKVFGRVILKRMFPVTNLF